MLTQLKFIKIGSLLSGVDTEAKKLTLTLFYEFNERFHQFSPQ